MVVGTDIEAGMVIMVIPLYEQYDRGYYYDFKELPFPLAQSGEELKEVIANFDRSAYLNRLDLFLNDTLGLKERGVAAKELARWMRQRMIK